MKYTVVIFPTKKVQDIINSYRKRYDPHYAFIPPYLTLKEPFDASDDEIQAFIEEMHAVAKEIAPFPLHVYKISSFHPVNNVIYGKVKENESLMELHRKLNAKGFDPKQKYPFVPHIIIARDLSDDEHFDVLARLKMKKLDFQETVDRFHLLYQLDDGMWNVYETFHLRKHDL